MTNCTIIQNALDELLDGELTAATEAEYRQHIEGCESCRKALDDTQAIRELLANTLVPAASRGFEDRVFANIRHAYEPHSNHKAFYAGFGTAIAATVVLFILGSLYMQPQLQKPVQDALPEVTLSLYQPKKVNMVFNVPEAVADATFSMQLPEHVAIAGYEGHHTIEWQTALKAGKNLLSLPIVAQQIKQGEIIAKIKYGNNEKVFRLQLKIEPAVNSMIMIEQETV